MSNVSGIGDAYYWSVFKIAEAFGLHRDTVKKRLLAANTPVAATVRGNPVYALQHVGPALFSVKHEAADSVHDPSRMEPKERKDWYRQFLDGRASCCVSDLGATGLQITDCRTGV